MYASRAHLRKGAQWLHYYYNIIISAPGKFWMQNEPCINIFLYIVYRAPFLIKTIVKTKETSSDLKTGGVVPVEGWFVGNM